MPRMSRPTQVHAAGLVIKDLPVRASNFRQTMTLAQYLQRESVVRDRRHRHATADAGAALAAARRTAAS